MDDADLFHAVLRPAGLVFRSDRLHIRRLDLRALGQFVAQLGQLVVGAQPAHGALLLLRPARLVERDQPAEQGLFRVLLLRRLVRAGAGRARFADQRVDQVALAVGAQQRPVDLVVQLAQDSDQPGVVDVPLGLAERRDGGAGRQRAHPFEDVVKRAAEVTSPRRPPIEALGINQVAPNFPVVGPVPDLEARVRALHSRQLSKRRG